MKIIVAGIGPGSREDITPAVMDAVAASNVIVGYKYYFQFVEEYLSPGAVCVDSGMRKERERAKQAFEYALQGLDVCVISSGDAGIYGMAPLIWEMYLYLKEQGEQKIGELELKVIPGMECGIKVYAVRRLLYGESPESVLIVLPQGEPVRMKIKSAGGDGEKAWGCAEKFSGDDPDITGGKEIFATLRLNWEGSV